MKKGKTLRVAALLTATACATMMMLAACGEKPVEHTHTLQEVAAVAATCTTAGTEAYYKCTDPECGKLFSDDKGETEITAAKVVPAKGHNMTKHEAVTATCTGEGTVEYYTCANEAADVYYADDQGAQKLETISTPKTNHQLVVVPKIEATCGATGTEAYWNCLTCQHKFSDSEGKIEIQAPVVIDKLQNHGDPILKLDEDGNLPMPTLTGGILEQVCSICGAPLDGISYIGGFSPVASAMNSTTSSEINQAGTYYATTSKEWRQNSFGDQSDPTNGTWAYTAKVYVVFKVREAGAYTISFEDLLPQEGVYRVLSHVAIDNTDIKSTMSSKVMISNGKVSTNSAQKTKYESFSISFKNSDLTGDVTEKNKLDSILFNITQENIDTYGGSEKTLYVKIGVAYMETVEGKGVAVTDRVIPLLISLKHDIT